MATFLVPQESHTEYRVLTLELTLSCAWYIVAFSMLDSTSSVVKHVASNRRFAIRASGRSQGLNRAFSWRAGAGCALNCGICAELGSPPRLPYISTAPYTAYMRANGWRRVTL